MNIIWFSTAFVICKERNGCIFMQKGNNCKRFLKKINSLCCTGNQNQKECILISTSKIYQDTLLLILITSVGDLILSIVCLFMVVSGV